MPRTTIPFLLLLLTVSLSCSFGADPTTVPTRRPPPTRQSQADIVCEKALAEMERLLDIGSMSVTSQDPRGHLADLVNECIRNGRLD